MALSSDITPVAEKILSTNAGRFVSGFIVFDQGKIAWNRRPGCLEVTPGNEGMPKACRMRLFSQNRWRL